MLERSIQRDQIGLCPFVSIADIAIWRVLGWFTSGLLDGMPKDLLTDFPKLKSVFSCRSTPESTEWIGRTYPKIMSGALTDLKEAMIVSSGPLNNDPHWPDVQPNTMLALDREGNHADSHEYGWQPGMLE